mmetsp:Transcript_24863/g.52057  ORF Transcript_24863/g.52057 Transcript_24863/m.52057 type:complete len:218 (-) Transcript_24863:196-849(-)
MSTSFRTKIAMIAAERLMAGLIVIRVKSPRICCAPRPIYRIAVRVIRADPLSHAEPRSKSVSSLGVLGAPLGTFRGFMQGFRERTVGSNVRCVRVVTMPPRLDLTVVVTVEVATMEVATMEVATLMDLATMTLPGNLPRNLKGGLPGNLQGQNQARINLPGNLPKNLRRAILPMIDSRTIISPYGMMTVEAIGAPRFYNPSFGAESCTLLLLCFAVF